MGIEEWQIPQSIGSVLTLILSQTLIEGEEINVTDYNAQTPLITAALHNHWEIVRYLRQNLHRQIGKNTKRNHEAYTRVQ